MPIFKQQNSGFIINIASAGIILAAPGMAAYNATKAAVVALSETLYAELMEYKIQISVVIPTFFQTNIMQYARGEVDMKNSTHELIQASGISANIIAEFILQQAAKNCFYILFPKKARSLYRLKRLFSIWFLNSKQYEKLKKDFLTKILAQKRRARKY